ncbi:hypothetical protein [Streptomyces atratus]|uniref:hypothetical protein n=1 Tax=Streptomyces atratus TaxID=1893 RepID=UPI001E5D44B3|nr:hypothetical protein [Streptomyces atratus]
MLSAEEFTREVTEVLLTAAPSLTGRQILLVRGGAGPFREEARLDGGLSHDGAALLK